MLTWAIVYLIVKAQVEMPSIILVIALIADASMVVAIANSFGK